MSRRTTTPLLVLAAAVVGVAAGLVVEGASGADEVSGAPLGRTIAALKQAPREQLESYRSGPRVLGVPRKQLESIAECESHGNPRSVSSDGTYRGKYQFDRSTWHSNGGKGDPVAASELEQDLRAAQVIKIRGSSPWPNCG